MGRHQETGQGISKEQLLNYVKGLVISYKTSSFFIQEF
jgi:hypothetical protein